MVPGRQTERATLSASEPWRAASGDGVCKDFDGSNKWLEHQIPTPSHEIAQDEAQATDGLLDFSACDKGCWETIPTRGSGGRGGDGEKHVPITVLKALASSTRTTPKPSHGPYGGEGGPCALQHALTSDALFGQARTARHMDG
jgi:hypothetical protein